MLNIEKLSNARSFLFVPGNKPERFEKALQSGADAVIIDLEDAVSASEKDFARAAVLDFVNRNLDAVIVRINPIDSDELEKDAKFLSGKLKFIMLPKTESCDDIKKINFLFGDNIYLIPLIESAKGVSQSDSIASGNKIIRIAFGNIDFSTEVGINPDDNHALLPIRSRLLISSVMAGIPPPIDGVTTNFRDVETVNAETLYSKSIGYTAKLCIHPSQILPVHNAFKPTDAEIAWAKSILPEKLDTNAYSLNGKMIDKPVILKAQRILEKSQNTTSKES